MSKKKLLRNCDRVKEDRLPQKINQYVWEKVISGTELPSFRHLSSTNISQLQVDEMKDMDYIK